MYDIRNIMFVIDSAITECIGDTFEYVTKFVEIKRKDQFVLSVIELVQLDKFNFSKRYIIEIEYH